jgi:hypothetical protein
MKDENMIEMISRQITIFGHGRMDWIQMVRGWNQ